MIVSLLLVTLICAGVYVTSHRLDGFRLFLFTVLIAGGAVLVVVPSLATTLARSLGVGRGTDLMLYVVTLTGVFLVSHFHFRSEQQARQISIINRELAILRADFDTSKFSQSFEILELASSDSTFSQDLLFPLSSDDV